MKASNGPGAAPGAAAAGASRYVSSDSRLMGILVGAPASAHW